MSKVDSTAQVPLYKKIIFSGISGAIATTCIYPIDITKTKLQDQKAGVKLYNGPLDCAKQIIQKEGFRGLYRGWPPNVVLVMPEKAIKLTANDYFRNLLRNSRPNKDLPVTMELLAGGLAGFCQVIMTNPMELLKIQGATVAEKLKSGELKEFPGYTHLVRQLGVSGLYTGVMSTLARDVPFSMVYFCLYAQSKSWLCGDQATPSGVNAFLAGAIAGTTAAAITCPIDVIKTRVHSQARPEKLNASQFFSREFSLITQTTSKLLANEGSAALFKGIVPRCLIISPLFAITMTCYEKFQQRFG